MSMSGIQVYTAKSTTQNIHRETSHPSFQGPGAPAAKPSVKASSPQNVAGQLRELFNKPAAKATGAIIIGGGTAATAAYLIAKEQAVASGAAKAAPAAKAAASGAGFLSGFKTPVIAPITKGLLNFGANIGEGIGAIGKGIGVGLYKFAPFFGKGLVGLGKGLGLGIYSIAKIPVGIIGSL